MLIENITKNILSGAEPAITKFRTGLFFVFVLFNSPNIDNLFSPIIFFNSIINSIKIFSELTQETALGYYFFGAISIYFILPYFHYYLCCVFSKFEISSAKKLISVSETLSKKNDDELKVLIIGRFEEFELAAKTALLEINGIIKYIESLTIAIVLYIYFIFKFDLSYCFLPVFISIWMALMLLSMRKIVLRYLGDILPYKVLAARHNVVLSMGE